MESFWDERYSTAEYVYGENPNVFFAEQLNGLQAEKILLPAEGEGRNAVYAASCGWDVFASDQSNAGCRKALNLAARRNVKIGYQVGEIAKLEYPAESIDAMGLIFAHFQGNKRREYHQFLSEFLKSGAIVILEGFSKKHIAHQRTNPFAGGPRDASMLFSINEINADFLNFDTILLEEKDIELSEGTFHQGTASVIRYVGRKR